MRAWLGPKVDYRPMLPVTEPGLRIVFGIGLIVLGAMFLPLPRLARVQHWLVGMICFGIAMIGSAIMQLRHEKGVRDELARAQREWPELVAAAENTLRSGGSMARCLQQRGYEQYFVRRWIADTLKQQLATSEDELG